MLPLLLALAEWDERVALWAGLLVSALTVLLLGRRIAAWLMAPMVIVKEQADMRHEIAELRQVVKELSDKVDKLATVVAVIRDRQKRIVDRFDPPDADD